MLYSLLEVVDVVHGLLAPLATKPENKLHNVQLGSSQGTMSLARDFFLLLQ